MTQQLKSMHNSNIHLKREHNQS